MRRAIPAIHPHCAAVNEILQAAELPGRVRMLDEAVTTARAGLGLALVNSEGRLYAVGGGNASNVLGTNERYTP